MRKYIFLSFVASFAFLTLMLSCDSSSDSDIIRWDGNNEYPNIKVFVGDEGGAVERLFSEQSEDPLERDSTILSRKDIPNLIKRHFQSRYNQNKYASFMLEFKGDKAMYVIQDHIGSGNKKQVIAPYSERDGKLFIEVGGKETFVAFIDEKSNDYYLIETMYKYPIDKIIEGELVKQDTVVYTYENKDFEQVKLDLGTDFFKELTSVKDTLIYTNIKYRFR